MPTHFQSLRPMMHTKDLRGSIEFYTKHLGFTCDGFSAADGWANLRRDEICIMLASPNTGSLYFNVDDAAALWATVKDAAKVCYPIEDFPYGMREFAIFDNNGYLLQFGNPI